MNIIPLYLVSGFLGSGKTTLLKRVLEDFGNVIKIGIIQTEFPLSSIDYGFKEYSHIPFSLLEYNRGSASCISLSSDFPDLFISFINLNTPDVLFLETSGLVNLNDIINMLSSGPLKDRVALNRGYTIIDASRFDQEVTFLKSLKNQIRVSDVVVINKYEKLNRLESHKTILTGHNYKRIESWVTSLNPFATIIPAVNSTLPESELSFSSVNDTTYKKKAFLKRVLTSSDIFKESEVGLIESVLCKVDFAYGYIRTENGVIAISFNKGVARKLNYAYPVNETVIVLYAVKNHLSALAKILSNE